MEKKKIYYKKETAPMGYYKVLRVLFIIGALCVNVIREHRE